VLGASARLYGDAARGELASVRSTRSDHHVFVRLREPRTEVATNTARSDHQRSHRASVLAKALKITRAPQVGFSNPARFVGLFLTPSIDQVNK
jgi:hypothetical protein